MKQAQAPRIILASASPRRQELLRRIGLEFDVEPANVDEEALHRGAPRDDAARAAYAKAAAVARRAPEGLVLAADTMVVLEGRVFGKPAVRDQAREFLQALSGRTHSVITGVALIDAASGASKTGVEETFVTFRPIPTEEIEAYLDTPDPYDKAGAYGIQSGGGRFVSRVEGDYFNVVGLPLALLLRLLAGFIDIRSLRLPIPPRANA